MNVCCLQRNRGIERVAIICNPVALRLRRGNASFFEGPSDSKALRKSLVPYSTRRDVVSDKTDGSSGEHADQRAPLASIKSAKTLRVSINRRSRPAPRQARLATLCPGKIALWGRWHPVLEIALYGWYENCSCDPPLRATDLTRKWVLSFNRDLLIPLSCGLLRIETHSHFAELTLLSRLEVVNGQDLTRVETAKSTSTIRRSESRHSVSLLRKGRE